MREHHYYVYILTNPHRTVLYTGVTKDLRRRMEEHKQKLVEGFTKRYNVDELVYFEYFRQIEAAIEREKQLKGGSRKKKDELINEANPEWRDLTEEVD